jgi:hypothetical protein
MPSRAHSFLASPGAFPLCAEIGSPVCAPSTLRVTCNCEGGRTVNVQLSSSIGASVTFGYPYSPDLYLSNVNVKDSFLDPVYYPCSLCKKAVSGKGLYSHLPMERLGSGLRECPCPGFSKDTNRILYRPSEDVNKPILDKVPTFATKIL